MNEVKLSKEEYDRLLNYESKAKRQKTKEREYYAKMMLTMKKARDAGIVVTEEEIEKYCIDKWGKDY